MRRDRITRGWIILILALAMLVLMTSPVHALSEVSDAELSEVYAEGYSSFTIDLETGVAKALWNIETRTFTEIQSLKMGYYDDGTALGWDEDWTNVSLGSAAEDLVCTGLYIEARFSNLSDPSSRSLDSIKVGTPSMTGSISANFASFSGSIVSEGVTLVNGHRLQLTPVGYRTTITSAGGPDAEFYLKLDNTTGVEKGWWAFWGNATVTQVLVP